MTHGIEEQPTRPVREADDQQTCTSAPCVAKAELLATHGGFDEDCRDRRLRPSVPGSAVQTERITDTDRAWWHDQGHCFGPRVLR